MDGKMGTASFIFGTDLTWICLVPTSFPLLGHFLDVVSSAWSVLRDVFLYYYYYINSFMATAIFFCLHLDGRGSGGTVGWDGGGWEWDLDRNWDWAGWVGCVRW